RARAIRRVDECDVLRPLRRIPTERLRACASLVVHLLTFAVFVTSQRVEREASGLVLQIEHGAEAVALHELLDARLARVLNALCDVFARIVEAEVQTQVAPRTRAVRPQVGGLARLRATRHRNGVETVGLIMVVVESE